jgi:hypothetical protein
MFSAWIGAFDGGLARLSTGGGAAGSSAHDATPVRVRRPLHAQVVAGGLLLLRERLRSVLDKLHLELAAVYHLLEGLRVAGERL